MASRAKRARNNCRDESPEIYRRPFNRLAPELFDLWRRRDAGDPSAVHALFAAYAPIARFETIRIMRRYSHRFRDSFEDTLSDATLSLLQHLPSLRFDGLRLMAFTLAPRSFPICGGRTNRSTCGTVDRLKRPRPPRPTRRGGAGDLTWSEYFKKATAKNSPAISAAVEAVVAAEAS